MATLTADVARHVRRIPGDLKAEFPNIPLEAIEHDVTESARELIANARFGDFVPVLVYRAVRERLRAKT